MLTERLFVLKKRRLVVDKSCSDGRPYVELVSRWEPAFAGAATFFKREPARNYPHLRFVFVFAAKLLSAIRLVASSRKLSFAIRFVASSRNFLSRFDSLHPLESFFRDSICCVL